MNKQPALIPATIDRNDYTLTGRKIQLQSPSRSAFIILIICGLASTGLHLRILALGPLRERVPKFVTCYLALSVLFLLGCYQAVSCRCPVSLRTVVIFSVVFRFILFFSSPSLSDDIYRYLWEGYVQLKGVNPYAFPPQSPELVTYRNTLWALVNNKDASAIYPPFSQMFNAFVSVLPGSVWTFKAALVAWDAIVILLILRLLKLRKEKGENLIYYAWNPLVVVEVAASAHRDVLVIAALLAAALYT